MEYKKDYFGYVYEWTNIINGMKYIGSHYRSVEDYYAGSGKDFMKAYKRSPESFVMKVLEYVGKTIKNFYSKLKKSGLIVCLI